MCLPKYVRSITRISGGRKGMDRRKESFKRTQLQGARSSQLVGPLGPTVMRERLNCASMCDALRCS